MYMHEAQWLSFETGPRKGPKDLYGNPSPCFRKKFEISGEVACAVLDASAIGVFKAYINGEPVSNDYLSPGWTDYIKRIPLYSFDVTDKLRAQNAIAIVAGDGWAVGRLAPSMERCCYFDGIEVCARLTIDYKDGRRERVVTNTEWEAIAFEIGRSDIYAGELIDKRRAVPGFASYDGDGAGWTAPHSSISDIPFGKPNLYEHLDYARVAPTVVKKVLPAKFLHKTADGKLVYDFFQNFTGVIHAKLRGARGAKLIFRHGELLEPDGTLYTANLRRAEATDTVILAGDGAEDFRPLFTFHGFRYADVTVEGQAEILSIEGEAMYSDLAEAGSFSCSAPMVNRLYSNIVWGQRGNFLNVPTDCPQRDERLGWTGDAQIFCGTAMFNMDCRDFYRKYLTDVRDCQFGGGAVLGVAPAPFCRGKLRAVSYAAAGWADVIAVIPYEHYLMYGDTRIIKENLEAVKAHVNYYKTVSEDYVPPLLRRYGDWLNVDAETEPELVAVCYFAYSARLCAKMCRTVHDDDAAYFDGLYEEIKKAFRARYLTADGALSSDTQTAYLLAYAFGLLDEREAKPRLLAAVARRDDHLSTGFIGIKFLLPVLCEFGASELAYKLLTNTTYPSWGYSVVNGATTIWERWDGYRTETGIKEPSMNSFNHYSFGSCGEWLYKYCLGINPVEAAPGFKKVLFRPFTDGSGRLTHAEGSYQSVNGEIKAAWKTVAPGVFRYETAAPKGTEALYDFGAYKSAERVKKGTYILRG
ncbi:MAG: glycoside hydrolase family 78 protein [Clostridiales bacterium]|jgi:alpha-L-rhamnosidase|nr:glycoside hydrolase family 78 protein [Clostridiales bacterium]